MNGRQRLVIEAEPAFRTRHANPYNARLYWAIQNEGVTVRDLSYLRVLLLRVDVVHLHWPDLTFLSGHRQWRVIARLALFFSFLSVARLRGTRVMWTVHNAAPHERRSTSRLRAVLRRMLVANIDGIIALTADGIVAARGSFPEFRDVPAFVTPHGHYRADYDFFQSKSAARAQLGVSEETRLLVSAGQIRAYKNVPRLIEVFRATRVPDSLRAADTLLGIAGRPNGAGLADSIRSAAGDDPRVILESVFLSDERLATWLRAADLVVLPYSAIQNSGSAILALSAGRPVVVPRIGAMTELRQQIGSEWVFAYDGLFDESVLSNAVEWLEEVPRDDSPDLSALEWDAIAVQTIAAYRAVHALPRARAGKRSTTDNTAETASRTEHAASALSNE